MAENILSNINYEFHLPGCNFVGPNTKLTDRLSLNYDGTRGSENYMIATNWADYVAFEHDLIFHTPNDIIKRYGDSLFVKKMKGNYYNLGMLMILGQYAYRVGNDLLAVGSAAYSTYKYFDKIKNQINRIRLNNALYRLPIAVATYKFFANPLYNSVNKLYKIYLNEFEKNKEYMKVFNHVDKLTDLYDDYLFEVGEWKVEKTVIQSIIPDINFDFRFFKIKDVIDSEKAKNKYIKFYNEYKLYLKFLNDNYNTKYTIKELNMDNINLASKPKVLDDIYYNDIKNVFNDIYNTVFNKDYDKIKKVLDFDPNVLEYENIEEEQKVEIEKVLQGIIDVPFETPLDIPMTITTTEPPQETTTEAPQETTTEAPQETTTLSHSIDENNMMFNVEVGLFPDIHNNYINTNYTDLFQNVEVDEFPVIEPM
jgi:hypothetical protein